MKKVLAVLLILAMCTATAFAATSTSSFTVGKNKATYVSIPMDGTTKVTVTLGQDSVNKDMTIAEHIKAATAEFGVTPSVSVNGTYFNSYYSTKKALSFPSNCANITQTVMIDGQVVTGGGSGQHATLGITSDGKALIDNVEIKPYLEVAGKQYYAWGVNRNFVTQESGVTFLTEELGYPIDIPSSCTVLTIANGTIQSIDSGSSATTVPAGVTLVVFGSSIWSNATTWNPDLASVGSAAEIKYAYNASKGNNSDWEKVVIAVAGNPWILSDGVDQTANYTPTEAKLKRDAVLQRTFAGVKADGTLIIGTVSASPAGLASALASQGVVDAMLLDGGASSCLATNGTEVTKAGRKLANVIHFSIAGSAEPVEEVKEDVKEEVKEETKTDTPFTDVADTAYYKNAVKWAYEKAVTSGKTATLFGPTDSCTRGQVVTFLWRALGQPEPSTTTNPFTDVSASDYYYKPILWAYEKGITGGTSATEFSPNMKCSNAHIITFIWRALGKPDDTGASVWYADAKAWAEKNGLLTGTYTGSFDVTANCPRANVVEYLYRYYAK